MTAYPGTVYRYFSIDSDLDISASPLAVGLTLATATNAATYTASPPARVAASTPAAPAGTVRYWWRYLLGAGTALPMVIGHNSVYGILTDSPEVEPYRWDVLLTL